MTEQHEVLAKELANALNQFSENVTKIMQELFSLEGKPKKDWKMKCSYQYRDEIWVINSYGEVDSYIWFNSPADNAKFKFGNTFPTEQEAELETKRRELLTRFRTFRDECNGNWKPDWDEVDQEKYAIKCEKKTDFYVVAYWLVNEFNLFGYFKDDKDAKRAIELFGDEIKKLFIDCECD